MVNGKIGGAVIGCGGMGSGHAVGTPKRCQNT